MILYYHDHCSPCWSLKRTLDHMKIEYEGIDDDAIMLERGIEKTPTLELDDGTRYEFAEARAKLKAGEIK